MRVADEPIDVHLLAVLGRLRPHRGQVGDGVGHHAGGPRVRVGEGLLGRHHPVQAPEQDKHEDADEPGHDHGHRPGHDAQHDDGPERS